MRRAAALFLVLISVLFVPGCFPTAAQHGVVRTDESDPLITIEAGNLRTAYGNAFMFYVVDRRTHTCWLAGFEGLAALDCCALARVEQAREHLDWVNAEDCGQEAPAGNEPLNPYPP